MKSPAKRKISKGVIGAIGAATLGVAAGAAALFLSKKENRDNLKKAADKAVKVGKVEIAKAKKSVVAAKKKLLKKK